MATGLEVLKYYGITREQAMDFIMANVNNPEVIYDVASSYGITTQHLSDITHYSANAINNYFESSGLSTELLNEVKLLFNSNLGDLAYLVNFNSHTGSLSTASLREQVKASFSDDPSDYDAFFESIWGYEEADGLYTPDETGISHLGNIQATPESLESIFFGTLINIVNSLDIGELEQIGNFPFTEDNLNDFYALVSGSLSDMPATPYPDSFLEENVVNDAVTLIEDYWGPDSLVIGILDDSPFLGLVIA